MSKTPTTLPPGQAGRPLIKIDIEKVEALASRGLSQKQLAIGLGINLKTLQKHRKLDEELQSAIDRGQVQGLADVSNALFENAMAGNVTAQIFYLKNRSPEDWRDRIENRIEVIDLASMHLEAMRELVVIDGEVG
jgi:hypothetical protein